MVRVWLFPHNGDRAESAYGSRPGSDLFLQACVLELGSNMNWLLTAEHGRLAKTPITLGDTPRLSPLKDRVTVLNLKHKLHVDIAFWIPTRHGPFVASCTCDRKDQGTTISWVDIEAGRLVNIASYEGDLRWRGNSLDEAGGLGVSEQPGCCDDERGFWVTMGTPETEQLAWVSPTRGQLATVTRGRAVVKPLGSFGNCLYLMERFTSDAPANIVRIPLPR
jgi:hypothetical protein